MDEMVSMSLRQIKNEIIKLQNQLDHWCTKKKINFSKTQPQSFQYDKIKVDTSHVNNDPLTLYMIKDEECDTRIMALYESLLSYQELYRREVERMLQYDEIPLICYLKEEQKWNWKMIDKIMHYAEGYSKTKYMRYKKDTKNEIDTI